MLHDKIETRKDKSTERFTQTLATSCMSLTSFTFTSVPWRITIFYISFLRVDWALNIVHYFNMIFFLFFQVYLLQISIFICCSGLVRPGQCGKVSPWQAHCLTHSAGTLSLLWHWRGPTRCFLAGTFCSLELADSSVSMSYPSSHTQASHCTLTSGHYRVSK